MYYKKLNSKLPYYFIVLILLSTCARVSSPTGGPEDENPPQLVRSVPESGQLNYKGQSIVLVFDEIIQTNQIETGLIITPQPEGFFRTRAARNTVELIFTEPFKDSTTYAFSFANTIQDVTARNPAEDLTLSFSTGDYLDSLTIGGQILNLYDQLPMEATLVSLFSATDSLNVLTGSAQYYAKTDTAGRYRFQNLPPGDYRVYAFQDENNNNKADAEGELYGFYPDTLRLSENISEIDFTVQQLSTKALRRSSGRHFGKYYELTFNKSITDFRPIDGDNYTYLQKNEETVRFYRNNQLYNDTTQLIFEAQDSVGNVLVDTASFYFVESEIEPDPLKISITPQGSLLRPNDTITIQFNKPISLQQFDSLSLSLDSLNVFPFPQENARSDQYNSVLSFPIKIRDYAPRPDQKLTLQMKKGSFISIDGDTSAFVKKTYQAAQESETALISGRIISSAQNVIVQLLNTRTLDVIQEVNTSSFQFSYLDAGSYMIRVIQDINGNGKWDTGNILLNESPEPAQFYVDRNSNSQLIEVRKNWAVTDLIITLR